MPQINLKLEREQLEKTDYIAGQMSKTRTAYIREAIATYNADMEREILARKLKDASARCREESLRVVREMEAAAPVLADDNSDA